ncbi:PepSY domain-containing protein [Ferrovibrio sp.]|uniref:PepSY-associated TM helix domain-containing protein n=1 Tax=Ferrovibrio sp. TaxID=1917215 RepID=UPI001B64881A|nr:PepSY-associated TM helix domain-containing protein [Ferrovibrio sp.]MBP7065766.1 PepSY domain-containing protein [Ferrovibrio sp.]
MTQTGLRPRMAGLHIWLGLVFGWLLYAVFLTGTLSYFREEITLWMQPELPQRSAPPASADAATLAQDWLAAHGSGARRWLIELPNQRRPLLEIAVWRNPGGALPAFQRVALEPHTGLPNPGRQTRGGDFLYYFHFDLHMPWRSGRLLVGLATMAMLVALVSGVIVHKRIFSDFFTFRPGKGQRSWLDAHNVTGVLVLPFHLMIAYSGLITLMTLYLPWSVDLAYRGNAQAFALEAALPNLPPPGLIGGAAPLTDLAPLIRAAEAAWAGADSEERVGRIDVLWPQRQGSRILLIADDAGHISHHRNQFAHDGVSGVRLGDDAAVSWMAASERALYGLHLGRFADWPLRWLFFVAGAACTAMAATGLLLWAAKRRRQAAGLHFGHRLVDVLNVASLAGLPIAVAVLFWANRLLPLDLPQRAWREGIAFFAAWGLAALHAALRPHLAAWREQLGLGALLCLALPLLNAFTTGRGLDASLAAADWVFAGFDLCALAAGLLLAALAWRCRA